jgi:hypothetical protein
MYYEIAMTRKALENGGTLDEPGVRAGPSRQGGASYDGRSGAGRRRQAVIHGDNRREPGRARIGPTQTSSDGRPPGVRRPDCQRRGDAQEFQRLVSHPVLNRAHVEPRPKRPGGVGRTKRFVKNHLERLGAVRADRRPIQSLSEEASTKLALRAKAGTPSTLDPDALRGTRRLAMDDLHGFVAAIKVVRLTLSNQVSPACAPK